MTNTQSTDYEAAWVGVQALLRMAGEDPERPGLADTPKRFLAAFAEMTERPGDPESLLSVIFEEDTNEMIVVGPVPFTSLCEHHLLPFTGEAWIGYLPDKGIVGLSKLPRLLEHYARRPQVQERLTQQITTALDTYVTSKGSACLIRANHSCALLRGIKKPSPMTTSSLTRAFRDTEARAEFLAHARP